MKTILAITALAFTFGLNGYAQDAASQESAAPAPAEQQCCKGKKKACKATDSPCAQKAPCSDASKCCKGKKACPPSGQCGKQADDSRTDAAKAGATQEA